VVSLSNHEPRQFLEGRPVPADQSFLLLARPAFDLSFAEKGILTGGELLHEDHLYRTAAPCVPPDYSSLMRD
jgi:hypothetical protein